MDNGSFNLLTPRQVCAALNISPPTLWRMRREGRFPEPVHVTARRIGWPEDMVREWIAARQGDRRAA